jgi:hypothetical protein
MKKRKSKSIVKLKTGEHCHQSGWWRTEGVDSPPHFISEGSIMPAVAGSQVTWVFILTEPPLLTHAAYGAHRQS